MLPISDADEFMVVYGATVAFFIFFIDLPYCGNKSTCETKALRDSKNLLHERPLSYTICFTIPSEKSIHSTISPKKESEDISEKYYDLCTASRYPAFCMVGILESDICFDISTILHPGFMDAISRLPPPGGTTALDIFNTVLIVSYHISLRFLREFRTDSPTSLRVDIVFDADFETVLGENAAEFQDILLWHLKKIFRRSQSSIHTLTINRGSIGITFFINLVDCVYSKSMDYRYVTSKANAEQTENSPELERDETEFSQFLEYLNYRISSSHYHLLHKVPHYAENSSPEKYKQWTKMLDALESEIENLNSETAETVTTEIDNDLKYRRVLRRFMPSVESVNSDDVYAIRRGKVTSYQDYFGRKSSKNLHHRTRRYALREDEISMKLKISFKLENPAKNGNGDEFQRQLISQLAKAMRVPIPSISDLKVLSDSDVSFTLSAFNDGNNVMDDFSVIEAADCLKAKIKSQQLRLKDLNGQLLMTAGSAYASIDESVDYSLGVLIILCITLLILTILIITVIYIARRTSQLPRSTSKGRNEAYREFQFGRDSSQSIGKYSYDSGLWLGPGPEPNFTVPDAPYYRPPTVEQVASTPRPETAVRTRLKRNWNIDERALSTIPDNHGRNYIAQEVPPR